MENELIEPLELENEKETLIEELSNEHEQEISVDIEDFETPIKVSDEMIIASKMIDDYNMLTNKPRINEVVLEGNRELNEIGIIALSNNEIENLLKN